MIEFIRNQGEIIGEAECEMRMKALEFHAFARFGRLASPIRQAGRLGWVQRPTKSRISHVHLVAKKG